MDAPKSRNLSPSGLSVAAATASATTTLVTYPLDLIRTRFAVHDGQRKDLLKYRGIVHALRHIRAQEGFRGLYSGISASIVGSGISWGMYMMIYAAAKRELESNTITGTPQLMLSGVVAGAITALLTNPIWVIKTRLQTQIAERADGPRLPSHYKGAIDAAWKMYYHEGLASFGKGLVPALLASYHGAVQLTIYEKMCGWLAGGGISVVVDGPHSFIAGGTSKAGAMLATHPLTVVKSRLQERGAATRYSGFIDCCKLIWRNEGIIGMYKGISPSLLRLMLTSGFFFFLFEKNKQLLLSTNIFTE